jgi:hypothetical protein
VADKVVVIVGGGVFFDPNPHPQPISFSKTNSKTNPNPNLSLSTTQDLLESSSISADRSEEKSDEEEPILIGAVQRALEDCLAENNELVYPNPNPNPNFNPNPKP